MLPDWVLVQGDSLGTRRRPGVPVSHICSDFKQLRAGLPAGAGAVALHVEGPLSALAVAQAQTAAAAFARFYLLAAWLMPPGTQQFVAEDSPANEQTRGFHASATFSSFEIFCQVWSLIPRVAPASSCCVTQGKISRMFCVLLLSSYYFYY